jgi:hypothetical protein
MKQENSTNGNVPEYLTSYDSLAQHFRAELDGLSTAEKGDRFAHFVQRLVPQTEEGIAFETPELSEKKASDEGVDLTATSKDERSVLHIQSKLWVNSAEEIDSILSKFQAYYATRSSKLINDQYQFDLGERTPHFMLATLSRLGEILKKYERRPFSSRPFYDNLHTQHRIHFIDGEQVLKILLATYRKIGELPTNLVIGLETEAIQKENVFFGIISSAELQ